jgi:site-specific DNA-methyltransferase (cytosine-N4-specific)
MLTDRGDLVVDPFSGSCVTGEVSERLGRKWICIELIEQYLKGAVGRFTPRGMATAKVSSKGKRDEGYYRLPRPGLLWTGTHGELPLSVDGGKQRPASVNTSRPKRASVRGPEHDDLFPLAAMGVEASD